MKDAVATMGDILPEDAGGRDAVHVAVFSAVSQEHLFPGQSVGIVKEFGGGDMEVSSTATPIGIVDPFLNHSVSRTTRFWVFLFPRTITGLSHRWTHPSFGENGDEEKELVYATPNAKAASEQWLRNFCNASDAPSYLSVLARAERVADGESGSDYDDDYLHFDGQEAHGPIPPEFWDHVSVVLGQRILGPKARYFSCGC